ncbi:M4 family metallopeptidase [Olleya sp. R77988]|uniref:M4 family metallopeptidase n=1 Tax=Olleya sp. R77988 TaxID=3093875 RepID=UPI0037C5F215
MKQQKTISLLIFFFAFFAFAQEKRQKKFVKFDDSAKHQLRDASQIIKDNLQLSSDDELMKIKSETDQLGFTHDKFQLYFNGIKVEFATFEVHAKNGLIKTMNGELFSAGKIDITPTLSKETAFQRALSHTGAEHYLWEYPDACKEMDNYKKPEGELLILPGEVIGDSQARLAYKFDIYATQPISRGYLYIDAHTGKTLFFNAIIKHAEKFGHIGEVKEASKVDKIETLEAMFVSGSAQTRYSGTQTIETTLSGSNYTLNDAGRKVYTRDALNQSTSGYPYVSNYSEFTDNDNNWTTAEHSANKDNAALDAHWGAMETYDYFNSVHSRNSYDGNGAQIRSYVHVSTNYDNAFWNGSVMSYGDGSSNGNEGNGNFDALTSIDVAAHEIGHAICTFTADLAYQRESGGLNEGFSDIWGAAVEHFAKGNGNDSAPSAEVWLIGDEIDRRSGSVGLRSMSNPNARSQPDTYGGTYWQEPNCGTPTQANDYCGVHTNSGVLNHWFYLLTAGGSGTNDINDVFNVSGIGMTKAATIAYRTERFYLSSNSTFANARTGAIQAAEDLYGAGSQEVISTTNAWYAVGVGSEYVQACALAAPSSFAGSSVNDNGFTISWNSVSGAASYTVTVNGSSNTVSSTSYTATGLDPGTAYSCTVVANCSTGGSGTTSSTSVTTTGTAPLNYCASASTNINDEYIGRVQLGGIDNSSGGQFYSDFTSISTGLTKGTSNTITVTPIWTGTVYSEGYSVWIDYNQDGDFGDSGEQVWSQAVTQTTPVSGSFTVPTSATNGATRMRVSMKYNAVPTSCETFTYGEVEDYTVNITSGVADTTAPVITLTGASIINLEVGDTYNELGATATDNIDGNLTSSIVITGTVNTNSAGTYTRNYNVSDAAGNAASQVTRTVVVTVPADTIAPVITLTGASIINLEVGDSYSELGATATDNVDGNLTSSIVITGTVNTSLAGTYTRNYNVSDAAGNAANQVSRSIVVTEPITGTGCSGGISSFPYNEGFENTLGAWTQGSGDDFNWTVDANGTPSSNTGPSSASEGSYYVYMESSAPNYSTKRAILNSPCFDLSAVTQATFEFKYHMYGLTNMGSLDLEISDDNGTSWISVWNKSGNQGNAWATAIIDLSSYTGGSVQLRFNGITGTTWRGDMAVDAVNLSTDGGGTGNCSNVNLSITFDNYPEETAWSIVNASGTTVASGGTYGSQSDGSTLNVSVGCLDDGCYDLIFTDTYGDGICCSYGNGSYTLTNTDSGTTLASGGSFTSTETTNFCLSTSTVNHGFTSTVTTSNNLDQQFKVYPNPVEQILNIDLVGFEAQSFEIKNMLGQTVLKGRYTSSINVSKFDAGVYVLQLNIGEKTKVKRFIKQ